MVTSDDYSPAVGVINWIMMCSTVLSVCAQLGMKLFVTRELNLDNLVISLAMLFSIGQSIALAVLNANGLGMQPNTLTSSKIMIYSKVAFWTYFGVTNIMTEVLVIGLPFGFLWAVHISQKQRWIIFACLGVRVSIIGAVIAQLFFLHHDKSSLDFGRWPYYICMIFVQSLSLIKACFPFVKNFMLGLESGMIRIDNQEIRRKMSAADYLSSGSNQGTKYLKRTGSVANGATMSSPQEGLSMELTEIDNMRPEPIDHRTTISTTPGRPETGSESSFEGRIRATTEISVNHGG
ncbi:hypothetical protein HYALB_00002159 [Hymenoscyphus albidus]|uniref:Rhodopsin domain-containing protein n=1 Tax=Hymenoscyphus albidus TaxID=595503 RepID=A0A9N9LLZ3_9HELO|nr:hypothetical protein HYALB_00002159 [Hymenoscyphus albidus]